MSGSRKTPSSGPGLRAPSAPQANSHSTDPPRSGFSRRSFLKGSGAAVAATAIATGAEQATADDEQQITSGPEKITLNVNGENRTVTVEPRTSLLEVLRDQLGLTGCKDLQDIYVDGADTVMVDGKATYAGTTFALNVEGKAIRTVESLRDGRNIDPVIEGFVKHDGMQCGYCTPGFVVATRAFLDQNPTATLEDVQKGLGGNICRCGTYDGITKCALELAKGGA
ncbi:MAG: (2Fe-2S)-binding protein [Planctomycetaceae bacterium]|nr:(2Fe-2S)-binding protein [Planctomycetaceae bacterium]